MRRFDYTLNGITILAAKDIDGGIAIPANICLDSVNGGRQIELSSDGGVNYYIPADEVVGVGFNTAPILFPITHIRLTASSLDKAVLLTS